MIKKYEKQISNINSGVYYGIDLGTTYTVVACVDMSDKPLRSGQLPIKLITIPQYSPFEYDGTDKSEMLASIIGVDQKNNMYAGNKLYRLKGHPDFEKDRNLFYHWKLDLGVSQKPLYKNAVREDLDDASKVAGKILNYCRKCIHNSDKLWENVIVTVPASFQANQRADVVSAIEYAGIKKCDQMLIDEPNAAFIGFLNDATEQEKTLLFSKAKSRVLVIDFGGGTCDLSVLQLQTPENLQLKLSNLAISRYNDLGGQDIDAIIAEQYLLPVFIAEHKDENFTNEETELIIIPQLSVIAEKLKIDLSRIISSKYFEYAKIPDTSGLISTLNNQTVKVKNKNFTTEQFTLSFNQLRKINSLLFTNQEYRLQIVDKVIQSVPAVINDILKKANLNKNDIDRVLFAGGSVQNLMFVQETMQILPNSSVIIPGRPDLLIAKGAAVYSFYRYALGVELLKPICSDTIGVILQNAPFYPLIESGMTLPAEVDLPVFTVQSDFQKSVRIPFCIGNAEKTVQELVFDMPYGITRDTTISIKAGLTTNKLFTVSVKSDDIELATAEMVNPFLLANISDEERKLQTSLQKLEKAKQKNDRNEEKDVLESLIYEYYDLGNYTRCVSYGEEWLKNFDNTDSGINNILYCAYDNLGNRRKAEFYLDNGLKYSPNSSTLNYNKSLLIDKNEGISASLQYLHKLPEKLQNSTSIKFRIAILEYHKGKKEKAGKIAEEYNNGGYSNVRDFDYGLLKQIVHLFGFKMRKFETKYEDENKETVSINSGDLLRVKADYPTVL